MIAAASFCLTWAFLITSDNVQIRAVGSFRYASKAVLIQSRGCRFHELGHKYYLQ